MCEKVRFHLAKNEVSSPEGCGHKRQPVTLVHPLTPEQQQEKKKKKDIKRARYQFLIS